MPKDIQLSPHFMLSEMVKSSTATRLGIDNWPTDPEVINSLKRLCVNVLEPVRTHYQKPIKPNSGYRCLELNRALRSKDSSQHVKGQAVDFEIAGFDNYVVAHWCQNNLEFDQLLLEFYTPGDPTSGWVHISYVDLAHNRKSVLTINKNGVQHGLVNK